MNETQRLRRASLARLAQRWRQVMLEVVLLCLCIGLALTADGFFTAQNLLNVLRNVSMQGVIAFGMTLVIIAGEIDLSVGSAVAFAGCVAAWGVQFLTRRSGLPVALSVGIAMAGALACGTLIGCATGYLRARFRVPSFIATLAWMTVLRGAAQLLTNGFPLTPFPEWYNFFGGGYVAGIPFPAIVFLLVFAAMQLLAGYTVFGRAVYAVGGNAEAARLSGIDIMQVKMKVLGLVGFLAALSGLMQSSQILSGSAATATGWELDVISAVIIGGTSLAGGAGSIWGTLVGVVFLGVLVDGMTLLNISEYWQFVVRGILILAAVLMNVSLASGEERAKSS